MALSRKLMAISLVSFDTGTMLSLAKVGAVIMRAAIAANLISLIGNPLLVFCILKVRYSFSNICPVLPFTLTILRSIYRILS
jgi:hypothetical protein